MPGHRGERLTTGLHRRLAETKALQEVLPQCSIAMAHRKQHRQTWAIEATGDHGLASDQRRRNNRPRQPRPASPLRLRHGIGGKQPDSRKLGRGIGLVWFCHRGLRPASQLGQPTGQEQANTESDGQGAIFGGGSLTPHGRCQKSTSQQKARHQHNASGDSVISHRPHSCWQPNRRQSSHC